MISDKEFNEKIIQVCTDFVGQIDDLYSVIGMMQVGRLYGWKVMRFTARRGVWQQAQKLFGDPRDYMPERGLLAKKSIGLAKLDELNLYWEVIRGAAPTPEGRKGII